MTRRLFIVLLCVTPLLAATPAKDIASITEKACQDPPGIDITQRDIHHEFGHVKWAGLTEDEKAVWTAVWEAAIATGDQPCQTYVDENGKTGNYFERNAMEGFCVAYSYQQLGISMDSTIENALKNL